MDSSRDDIDDSVEQKERLKQYYMDTVIPEFEKP